MKPRPYGNFYMEEKYWEKNLGDSHNGLVEIVAGILEKEMGPSEKLLDVGCGKGNLEILLKDKFDSVLGIDASKNSIEHARMRSPKYKFSRVDIAKGLPFKDKHFDWVTCVEVLEHIETPVFVIKEMMRVGKNVIITCPNGFWTELRPTIHKGYINVPNYVHFTERQLKNLIKELGGKIVLFKYFSTSWKILRNIYPRFLSTGVIVVIS